MIIWFHMVQCKAGEPIFISFHVGIICSNESPAKINIMFVITAIHVHLGPGTFSLKVFGPKFT